MILEDIMSNKYIEENYTYKYYYIQSFLKAF
jgi:hypothetical protein